MDQNVNQNLNPAPQPAPAPQPNAENKKTRTCYRVMQIIGIVLIVIDLCGFALLGFYLRDHSFTGRATSKSAQNDFTHAIAYEEVNAGTHTVSKDECYRIVNEAHSDFYWLYYRLKDEGLIHDNEIYRENPEYIGYGEYYGSEIETRSELREYLINLGIYSSDFVDARFLSPDAYDNFYGGWIDVSGKLYFGYNWGMGFYDYDKTAFYVTENADGTYTVDCIAVPFEPGEMTDEIFNEYRESYTLEFQNGNLVITDYREY